MFGSSILDVAIGVVFIYLLLSLVCTAINEAVSSFVNQRGRNLFEGIKNLLNDPQFTRLAQQLYTHGLVAGISQDAADPGKPNRLPSYMPSKTFALALLDLLGSQGVVHSAPALVEREKHALDAASAKLAANPGDKGLQDEVSRCQAEFTKAQALLQQSDTLKQAHFDADLAAKDVGGPNDIARLRTASEKLQAALALGRSLAAQCPDPLCNIQKAIEQLPDGHTKESLLVLVEKTKRESALIAGRVGAAEQQLERFQQNVESWFNEAMDRVGGWYKRWTQKILLLVAVILVAAVNADTVMLAKRLTRDNALRASVVTVAERAVQGGSVPDRKELLNEAAQLGLPLGWVPDPKDPNVTDQIPDSFLGWALKIGGLLVSVLAVSLGAPFWFDTLSKFVNLRGTGTPPGEAKKSAPALAPSN